jgi:hypothetical protein
VTGFRAQELLRLAVRVGDIEVGKVVDVLVDSVGGRVLGVDILCRDESHRFLSLNAAEIGDGVIVAGSPFTLLAEDQLDFYRKRATTFRTLRGTPVHVHGRNVGPLADVIATPDGEITELVVANGRSRSHYRWDDTLRISASAA